MNRASMAKQITEVPMKKSKGYMGGGKVKAKSGYMDGGQVMCSPRKRMAMGEKV